MRIARLSLLVAIIATPLMAQTFVPGEVVVTGVIRADAIGTDVEIDIYDRNFVVDRRITSLASGALPDAVISQTGILYVTSGDLVRRLTRDGTALRSIGPLEASSIALSFMEMLYVGWRFGSTLSEYGPDGTLRRTYQLPVTGVESMDLAADQCTLYYLSGNQLGAFDVCTNTSRSLVSMSLPPQRARLRIDPSGNLLISYATAHYQVTPNGIILRQYPLPGPFHAFDVDPRYVWVSIPRPSGNDFARVLLETGAIVTGPFPSFAVSVDAIAVAGGWRAAFVTSAIPTASPVVLGALASVLCLFALLRLRA